jgi:hypothetical protein
MTPQPNRFFHLSIIFLLALNLVPHFNDHTVPVMAMGGICLAWRLLYEYQVVPLPNFFTKLGMILVTSYLVIQNYGQVLGLEAGTALLICAVTLKLIDGVGYRAAMVLLFLNFILLLARFFESQTLGITIFAAFDLIITTALLVQLHNSSKMKFDVLTLLKTGGKLFIQIAPLMILLFFVFPRFSTGLINTRSNRPSLKGFNDSMEPGSLSQLAQVNQAAFRVRFLGRSPSPLDMYWRGGVLAINSNMRWDKGRSEREKLGQAPLDLKKGIRQEILLEPVFDDWMFTLDRGVWVEHNNRWLQKRTRYSDQEIFSLEKSHNKRYIYEAVSFSERPGVLTDQQRRLYLQAPESIDERVNALVASLASEPNNERKAYKLMRFYQKEFRYTLNPGKLRTKELGEFLFEKKIGFCEHFAVSFASLMRLAGVPSRVVIGFQGGTKNNLSDYYLVTSRDAHAWTEIWSDTKKQWVRFDPTTVVAPLRFEIGGDLFHSMSEEELLQAQNNEDFLANYNMRWAKRAYYAFDAVSTNWNLFLLNFDQSGQRSFFARLGIKNVNQNLLLAVSLLILLSFFLWVRLTNKKKNQPENPAQVAYLNLRARLAKKGIEKESFEGPSDFLIRAQSEYLDQKDNLEDFRQLYLESYYGLKNQKNEIQSVLKKIR